MKKTFKLKVITLPDDHKPVKGQFTVDEWKLLFNALVVDTATTSNELDQLSKIDLLEKLEKQIFAN